MADVTIPFDELARLLGDRSRAVMLGAMMDGRQWTGRQLAGAASVTPSTASTHIKRLIDAGVVTGVARGRYKYYRIARPEIGRALETLMTISAPIVPSHTRLMPPSLRRLRMCYDHLAGVVAVRIADRLVEWGAVVMDDDAAALTERGYALFVTHGILLDAGNGRRAACRPCLDWSERRHHLAGRVGAAIARHATADGWVVREETRALTLTERGASGLRALFGLEV